MFASKSTNVFEIKHLELLQGVYPILSEQTRIFRDLAEELSPKAISLLYPLNGTLRVRSDTNKWVAAKNDILFLFPERKYTLEAYNQEFCDYMLLAITGASLPKILEFMDIDSENPRITGISNTNVLRELNQIKAHLAPLSEADTFSIIASLYRILAILFEEYSVTNWMQIPFNSKSIIYFGEWQYWPNPNSENNSECITTKPGSYAEFNFFGPGIKLVGTTNFDCGQADIFIDDIFIESIDTYSAGCLVKQLLYVNNKLSNDWHVIKVVNSGTGNPKSAGCTLAIESFHCISGVGERLSNEPAMAEPMSVMVKSVVDYIQMNYKETPTLQELAEHVNVSRGYLSTKFKAETGISIAKYTNGIKSSKAKNLLEYSDMSIGDIAAELGYQDVFYFSRVFKKEVGVSPSEFRKLHKR